MQRAKQFVLGCAVTLAMGLPMATASTANSNLDGGVCGPRDKVIERLSVRYAERQHAIGMTSGGSLVELFVSANGSWTFVHTTTEGLTCLLAAGENWEALQPVAEKDQVQPS